MADLESSVVHNSSVPVDVNIGSGSNGDAPDRDDGPESAASRRDMEIDEIISGPLSPVTDSEDDEGEEEKGEDEEGEDEEDEGRETLQQRRARTWEVLELLAYDYARQQYLVLWREVKRLNLTKTVSWEPRLNVVEDKRDPRLLSTKFWKNRPKKAATHFLRLDDTAEIQKHRYGMYNITHNGGVFKNKRDHEFSAPDALKLYWSVRKGAGIWN